MRILIDECLNWRLGRGLTGHFCRSVQRMGWAGISNGKLLRLAEDQFDVFLTGDRNPSFEQNTTSFKIAIIVLRAKSTDPRLSGTSLRTFVVFNTLARQRPAI